VRYTFVSLERVFLLLWLLTWKAFSIGESFCTYPLRIILKVACSYSISMHNPFSISIGQLFLFLWTYWIITMGFPCFCQIFLFFDGLWVLQHLLFWSRSSYPLKDYIRRPSDLEHQPKTRRWSYPRKCSSKKDFKPIFMWMWFLFVLTFFGWPNHSSVVRTCCWVCSILLSTN